MKVTIDESRCTGCLLCAKVCFTNYQATDGGKARAVEAPPMCVACGHCVAACPTGAISHPNVPDSECEALDEADRPTYEQFMGFLKMRRSRREFRDQDVPQGVIEKLLAAAVQAPNGCNRQNVHYTVVTDRQVLKEMSEKITDQTVKFMKLIGNPVGRSLFRLFCPSLFREMEPYLPLMDQIAALAGSGLDVVAYGAPCVILVHTEKHDMCGSEDSVYAAANIQYAAETLGLGTCCVGFITGPINADKGLKQLVHLPVDQKIQTSLIVGYPQFRYGRSAPKAAASATYVG